MYRRGPRSGRHNRRGHRVLHVLRLQPHQKRGRIRGDGRGHHHHQWLGIGHAEHAATTTHGRRGNLGVLRPRRFLRSGHGGRGDAFHARHHASHRRLRPRGRQCRRNSGAGPTGPRGTAAHRRLRRLGQHHRRHRQGVRHWVGGSHLTGTDGSLCTGGRLGCVGPAQRHHTGGPAHRGNAPLSLLVYDHEGGGPGGVPHGYRSAQTVPRDTGHHGRDRAP